MATFRKRGTSWEAQIRRQGRESVTRTFGTKADAAVWARQIEEKIDRGDLPALYREASHITLGDLLRRYRIEVTPTKKSVRQESNRIDRLLAHPMSLTFLAKMTPALFSRFREERLAAVGNQTVRHDLNLLSRVITVAMREWDAPIPNNPLTRISKPPIARARNQRVASPDLLALLRAADACCAELKPLIEFAVETGMRKSEILAIRWSDTVLETSILNIPVTKNGHPRTIPLSAKARSILKKLRREASDRPFPVTVPWLRYAWDRVTRLAKLENIHFHDLRHEAITRFFERGLSLPEVSLISGHREPRMLFRYTHLRAEDLAARLA